jgi:peptidyl-prolyl cis-trans isomerase C
VQALTKRPLLARTIKDPLFLFLVIGGGFFIAYNQLHAAGQEPIHYSTDLQKSLVADFELLTGRKATSADKAKLAKDYIADELLFRDAVDRGMYLTDAKVKKELVDKARYMIAGEPPDPTEAQLIDYYSRNTRAYQSEPQISFDQLFYINKPADPAAVLAKLNNGQALKGDDYWVGDQFPNFGDSMVRSIFGKPFLDQLRKQPAGQWTGPYQTSRGWHFIRKTGTAMPSLLPYPQVRDQVRQDYLAAIANTAIDSAVAQLEKKYDVKVDL